MSLNVKVNIDRVLADRVGLLSDNRHKVIPRLVLLNHSVNGVNRLRNLINDWHYARQGSAMVLRRTNERRASCFTQQSCWFRLLDLENLLGFCVDES